MFSKLIIVADYYLNQDYIAKNLCENRAKPESHCKGNCQLTKRLDKQSQRESSSNASEKKEVQLFFEKVYVLHIFQPIGFNKQKYPFLCEEVSGNYISQVFHPPAGQIS